MFISNISDLLKSDLLGVYSTIDKYYPIGVDRMDYSEYVVNPEFFEHHKIKLLEATCGEGMKNYESTWVPFQNSLIEDLGYKVDGTTMGQSPSYSLRIVLEKNQIEGKIEHEKELCCSISLIGKYFQIYGLDRTNVLDPHENRTSRYRAINIVTTSPHVASSNLIL